MEGGGVENFRPWPIVLCISIEHQDCRSLAVCLLLIGQLWIFWLAIHIRNPWPTGGSLCLCNFHSKTRPDARVQSAQNRSLSAWMNRRGIPPKPCCYFCVWSMYCNPCSAIPHSVIVSNGVGNRIGGPWRAGLVQNARMD